MLENKLQILEYYLNDMRNRGDAMNIEYTKLKRNSKDKKVDKVLKVPVETNEADPIKTVIGVFKFM